MERRIEGGGMEREKGRERGGGGDRRQKVAEALGLLMN